MFLICYLCFHNETFDLTHKRSMLAFLSKHTYAFKREEATVKPNNKITCSVVEKYHHYSTHVEREQLHEDD